jgi:hypothetical protein
MKVAPETGVIYAYINITSSFSPDVIVFTFILSQTTQILG